MLMLGVALASPKSEKYQLSLPIEAFLESSSALFASQNIILNWYASIELANLLFNQKKPVTR